MRIFRCNNYWIKKNSFERGNFRYTFIGSYKIKGKRLDTWGNSRIVQGAGYDPSLERNKGRTVADPNMPRRFVNVLKHCLAAKAADCSKQTRARREERPRG